MAQAVRDFLPVPSAEVAIERVFSGRGRVRHAMANAE
jgi:hypothetical protein